MYSYNHKSKPESQSCPKPKKSEGNLLLRRLHFIFVLFFGRSPPPPPYPTALLLVQEVAACVEGLNQLLVRSEVRGMGASWPLTTDMASLS